MFVAIDVVECSITEFKVEHEIYADGGVIELNLVSTETIYGVSY
jgi:hypothetical protein